MAIPSILLIPSGYKAGKLYSALPTNGDGDFTVTRNSVGTRVNENGIIEEVAANVPRLDYSDGGCPSLLLEPTSTNLVVDSVNGRPVNTSDLTNKVVSPDGLVNATRPVPLFVSARFEELVSAGAYATNTLLTYSWYRKRISTPLVTTFIGDLDTAQNNVNLVIETPNKQTASDVNGFDRFEVTVKVVDGSLSSTFRGYFGSIVGIGNLSVAYFGHQLEENSYATSYIKTVGTAQTRVLDVATLDLTPFSLTSITETIGGVEQTPITVIPSTYTVPYGLINKIIMI